MMRLRILLADMPPSLLEQFSPPVRQANFIRPLCVAEPLEGPDLALHVDLSDARGGDRMTRVERLIRAAPLDRYEQHLVTGHSGAGKSTELRRLAHELQQKKDGKIFHVLFVDVLHHLDNSDVELPDLLLALFTRLWQDPLLQVSTQASAVRLGNQVLRWVSELSIPIAKDLTKGIPLLGTLLKNAEVQRRYREKTWHHTAEVTALLSELIRDVRNDLVRRQEIDDLVIILDNLEKVQTRAVGERTSLDILFLEQLPAITALPVHLVLTFPVSLHARQGQLARAYPNSHTISIPMVRVIDRHTRRDDPRGFVALRAFLARRFDLNAVFASEAVIDEVIRCSGGCVRDLLRIVGNAISVRLTLPLTESDVAEAIQWLVADTERMLQSRPVVRHVYAIETTGSLAEVPASDQEWLLLNMVALEYNGETWYGVHPLVRKTYSYRRYLQVAAQPPSARAPALNSAPSKKPTPARKRGKP